MKHIRNIYEASLKATGQSLADLSKARFGRPSALNAFFFCHQFSRVTSVLVKRRRKPVHLDEVNNCGMGFWHAGEVQL